MGNAAAELAVVVTADTRDAESGLASLGSKVQSAGSAIAGLAAGAAVGGLTALAGGLAASVTAAAGFEQAMSAIQAVSGATGPQMQQLSSLALQLGKDTSFSASEAAAGIGELVKAGVGIGDVLGGAAAAALNLAAAGGLSVAEAATIASNAMNTFNLSGADMGHVADVIAGAANSSAIDVHDFGMSLSAVGSVASTIGVNFEDLATAIAVMGQAGLKGSDAGTSLKTMLLNLSPSSKRARDAMKELGLITADGANQFFTAEGKAKSLSEIAGVLQNALKGLTKEQQIQALQTIFGTDAIRAAAIMAKLGAEGFDEMAASMGKVTAADVAATRLDNLIGSFEQLKGSIETLGITLGMALLPLLRSGVDAVTGFVNSLIPLADEWGPRIAQTLRDIGATIQQVFAHDWSPDATIAPLTNAIGQLAIFVRDILLPPLMAFVGFMADHTEIIIGFGAALLTIVGASAVISVITGIAAAISFLLSPIGLVAAAVGLLVAAWVGNWGDIQGKTQAVIDFITPYVIQGLQAIQDFWTAWGPTILAAASAAWEGVKSATQAAIDAIVAIVQGAVAIWDGLVQAWQTLVTTAQTTWDTITTTISTAWDTITSTISGAIQTVSDTISTAWQAIVDFITTTMATIQQTIAAIWQAIPEDIRADLELITATLIERGAAWVQWAIDTTTSMLTTFTTWIANVVAAITQWATDTSTQFTTLSTNATTTVTTMTTTLLQTIGEWITTTVAAIIQWAVDFLAPITALISPAVAAASEIGLGILTSIQSALESAISALRSWGTSVLSTLRELISRASGAAREIGMAIMDGIISGAQSLAGRLGSVLAQIVRDALSRAKAALGIDSPSKVFADQVGKMIPAGVIQGIEDMARPLAQAVESMLSTVAIGRSSPALAAGGGAAVASSVGSAMVVNVQVDVRGSALASRSEIADAVVVGLQAAQSLGRTRVRVV